MVPDNFLFRCVLIFQIIVRQGWAVLAAGKIQKNKTEQNVTLFELRSYKCHKSREFGLVSDILLKCHLFCLSSLSLCLLGSRGGGGLGGLDKTEILSHRAI